MTESKCHEQSVLRRVLFVFAVGAVIAPMAAPDIAAVEEELTDQAISTAVDNEFLSDPAVPFDNIDVDTENGVVILSGTVNNILARDRATRIAETVKGVRAVVNRVEISPADRRSDGAIRKDVENALLQDPATDTYMIDVSVNDGVVTLAGTVDSWQEKQLAANVAEGVRGVVGLANEIVVDYKAQRPDTEIKAEIEETLRWDTLVDHALIETEVNDGRVTLSGTVGSAAEKRRARMDAWVAGVKSVDVSGLEVERWARDEDLRADKYAAKSDEDIRRAVGDAFLDDPRMNSFDVDVGVSAGVVTLRGVVDNLKARRTAAQDAGNTVGVWSVKNLLKVRPSTEVADDAVAAGISDALARDPYVGRSDIEVTVTDGVAYLNGTVDSQFERDQADDVASRVNGVIRVVNNLEITRAGVERPTYRPYVDDWSAHNYDWYGTKPGHALKSDRQIAQDIKNELWWSPFVNAGDVNVSVEGGVATLTGSVDSWSERSAATENAYKGGAVWVDNELALR